MGPQRDMPWILASASPRRRELLARAGQRFEVVPSEVDETPREGEPPRALVARLACTKAEEVSRRRPARWVLAADTIVAIGAIALGKPAGEDEAGRMLRCLSGRTHHVMTAYALVSADGRLHREGIATTEVTFRALADDEIEAYVATGEPRDKAGAYAIQGAGGRLVESIRGSRSNVVGLPMEDVEKVLRGAGLWVEEPA